ncbi:uncharacterized protein LOC115449169 isoform X2 [Manduca sexta]|uniref:uncharacterized protein LOC115449169 isoform X2 n=1 Tax=Manduca sexta TaxID=7130 RepID=UPI00188E3F03|nr:uncharacterized protein LOC115449169 isoform X2 [Manduca sexta]
MTVMVKRWYRSRRYQFVIFVVIVFCFIYYISLNDSLHREPDLDITRRNSVIEYIENRLQESLKEDKGTGCDIPHLDPFAKEVTQFDKVLPKVVCDGRDWVKCYLSECKVVPEILATTRDIVCTYWDIIHKSDKEHYLGAPRDVKDDEVYVLEKSDHVKIKCIGTHLNSMLHSKWTGHSLGFRTTVVRKPPPPGRENTINILIFGFDSTSKNGFIRRMPKSYEFLTKELEGIVLQGYNILGDGTPAALFPILTGKNELELPDVRKKMKNNGTMDMMPFIFYKLRDDGYRTAYFEDMPWIGTFQYRFNGFKHQPADHYLRSFYLEESSSGKKWWKGGSNNKYCIGDTPQYKMMMNITEQFLSLDGKKFCFTFIADITHDDFNMISTADEHTVEFLQALRDQGRLRDTLLFVMGDHGPRYAKVRDTLQGKLEERLPFMTIVLPETLRRSRPEALDALKHNAHVLTTPHDIHATVLDAMDLQRYWNPYKVRGADLARGLTLFEPIPKNRSCSEAGIEPHWCTCLRWLNVSDADPLYHRAARAVVDYINSLTEPVRSLCAVRSLLEVSWESRWRANSRLLSFVEARDADGYVGRFGAGLRPDKEHWQVKIAVGPGRGVYEASMTYTKKEDKFLVNARDISRTNAYNNEPSCISATHPHLNMFCYCNG